MSDDTKQAPNGVNFIGAQRVDYIYFNGFELNATLSDIGLMIMIDGQPQAKLAMSFTTAKTLARNLSEAVSAFEKATDNTLLTMEDIRIAYEKSSE